jgi:predicted nucleic acid-binding protein
MNLFIDTNIFLDFYHLSGPDIEELHKLTALLERGRLKLFIPNQLRDEFRRNRDNKIKDAMNKFGDVKFTIKFPAFCKLYPEYRELQILLNSLNTKHTQLFQRAKNDIDEELLSADVVIGELFNNSKRIEITNKIFNQALQRFRLGNPPGDKKVTMGDEVNWEALLEAVPNEEDLSLVSRDSDYAAAMDPDKFNPFLDKEWTSKKKEGSSVKFYSSIQAFFKANFPSIKLASDVKKDELIENLASSGSFYKTHLVIAKLSEIDDFSPDQVEQLIQIAQTNKQVTRIIGDSDVFDFYDKLMQKYSGKLSLESRARVIELISEQRKEEVDDDIPF